LYSFLRTENGIEHTHIKNNVRYATGLGGANFAITTNNTLYAWGTNRLPDHWRPTPPLGDGTTIDRETPVRSLENIAQISAVGNTVYAIGLDGTLWGWGNAGAPILLGDGSEFIVPENIWDYWEFAYEYTADGHLIERGLRWLPENYYDFGLRLSPVKIMENVAQISATYAQYDHGWIRSFRAFAVTTNGELYAWGINDEFESGWSLLGDGTSEPRPYPVRIN
jgi:alpha-tubulin suppressor-like RCC1 family protein